MGIAHYLAMTAAELSWNPAPAHTAWMACHFSSYHGGISNLPPALPPGSLLLLDDSVPIDGHDPQLILEGLSGCVQALDCPGVLLDFQRPDCPQAREMAEYLTSHLPCPAAVSSLYAQELSCPVFLPPAPLHSSLEAHFAPWKGREIWLETALEAQTMTLTKDGCGICTGAEIPETGFEEKNLHCHYNIETGQDFARFTLWRTKEDLDALLQAAEGYGATLAVGLWQEMCRSI